MALDDSWRRSRLGAAIARFAAGLMIAAPALPLAATGTSIMLYVSPSATMSRPAEPPVADATKPATDATKPAAQAAPPAPVPAGRIVLLRGLAVGMAVWVVLGIVGGLLATVDRANRSVYRELRTRMDALDIDAQSLAHRATTDTEGSAASPDVRAAEELRRHVDNLRRELGGSTR